MPGKAYMADVVKRDMQRLSELFEEVKSGLSCGYDTSEEVEEISKILDSYNQS